MTVYDTTPGDGAATKNSFDASVSGGIKLSADVLFTPGQHGAAGGVMALYSEGQDGLALLASNGGGNNPDVPKLSLIFKAAGPANNGTSPITLTSTSLASTSFAADQWYRVTLALEVSGDTWTANGTFNAHSNPSDPNSALGGLIATLNYSGLLSDPDTSLRVLTNPGEVGIMALTTEGFSDGGCAPANFPTADAPHTYVTGCNDNVGVSVTNFEIPTNPVPEPSSVLLLSTGLVGLAGLAARRRAAEKKASAASMGV